MHFYKRDLDEWGRMTAHLTLTENGALDRLVGFVAKSEQPLLRDLELLCRRLRAETGPEKKAVRAILKEFFEETDAGYTSPWVTALIERCSHKKKALQQNGSLGGIATANARKEASKPPANADDPSANGQQNPANPQPLQDFRTSGLQDSTTSSLQDPITSGLQEPMPSPALPPAVKFPPSFPKTEAEALAWARGGTVIIDRDDAWIRAVWHQVIGQGFKAGNGVLISHWASYLNARQHKGDDRFSEAQSGNSPQKKKGGAWVNDQAEANIRVITDASLPEPPCDWRALLKELYPPEQFEGADYTLPWGLYQPDQRRALIVLAKQRALLPAAWKQARGDLKA